MVRAVIWLSAFLASLAVHSVLLLAVSGLAHQNNPPPLAELLIGDGAVLPEPVTAQAAGDIAALPAEIATAQPAQSALSENGITPVAPVTAAANQSAVESETTAPAPSEARIAAVSPDEAISPQAVTGKPAAAITGNEQTPVNETTGAAPLDAATPATPAEQRDAATAAIQPDGAPLADSPAAVAPSAQTPVAAPSSESSSAVATEPSTSAPVSEGSVSTPVSETSAAAPQTGPVAALSPQESKNAEPSAPESSTAAPTAPNAAIDVAPATDSSNQQPVTDTATAAPETAPAAPSTSIAPAASQDTTSSAQQAEQQVALGPITPPPETITERMHRFLRGYDGGGCFFAVPVALDSARPRIDGFGSTTDPIRTFGEEFKRTLGIEPQIEVRTITDAQCPAIHFVGGLLKSRFPELGVKLELDQIASGKELRGALEGVHLPWVYLVLIDDDGMVQDLSQHLSNTDGHLTFAAPMFVKGEGQMRNQLLVGVATSRELSLLKIDKPIRGEDFLPAVVEEADRLGADVALGVGAFRVE